MSLYYVSENHTLVSISYSIGSEENFWTQDTDIGNYSTAVDTRSLSISLFPVATNTSGQNSTNNNNVALLYYETPNGKVSALLQIYVSEEENEFRWIDITSQESKTLPKEFRNAPGFNYSDTVDANPDDANPFTFSHTLHEADPTAVYSTPFFSAPGFDTDAGSVGAMFYAGDDISFIGYKVDHEGSGNFTLPGIHYAAPYTEYFQLVDIYARIYNIIKRIYFNPPVRYCRFWLILWYLDKRHAAGSDSP